MGRILFQLFYFATFLTVFFVVLLSVYGYTYDFQTQEIKRLGVVTLNSTNVAEAEVSLDTEKTYSKLPFPAELHDVPVGARTLRIQKPGYELWEYQTEVDDFYVTEVGNILLRPKQMSAMESVYPTSLDQCFFSEAESYGVVCIEESKKIAYILQISSKRTLGTEILELDTSTLSNVHWIDKDRVLFLFQKSLPLVYQFSTKAWQPLTLDSEYINELAQGVLSGPHIFVQTPQGLLRRNILDGTSLYNESIQTLGLMLYEGKLWVQLPGGWQRISEQTLKLTGPLVATFPGQIPTEQDAFQAQAILYTNSLHELLRRDPESGSISTITRFSGPITELEPSMHPEYWRVGTQADRYLCHEWRSEPCIYIGPNSAMTYVDEKHHILYVLKDRTLSLIDMTLDVDHELFPPVVIQ